MDPSTAGAKKSRAKSCTSCRQVKLRCDMRDTYPAPCSRCRDRKQECKMDSSFKRVDVRRQGEVSADRANLFNGLQHTLPSFSHHTQNPSPSSSFSASENYHSDTPWLDLDPAPLITARFSESWSMGETLIDYATARELFEHFEEFYLPNMPILEPVTSFTGLFAASSMLFWAIIFVSARHHPIHLEVHPKIHEPYRKIFGDFLTRPVHSLKDLHALLLLITWPFEVESQQEDPAWIHCGMAVNTALYMGLNRLEDENLFGSRLTKHFQQMANLRCRKMTWMKCFQLSTQLSTWYGLEYTAPGMRTISQFYDEKNIPLDFIAMTETQRQVGRYVAALDGHACDSLAMSLVPQFVHDFDAIKTRYSKVWSFSTEINLQSAKLYMFAMCLISTDHNSLKSMKDTDVAIFLHKVLQWGHTSALGLISLMAEASAAKTEKPSCGRYEDGGSPILATPKQHFRLAFFACCFLLKFLDTGTASAADRDSARNAVSNLFHQTFMRFPSQPQLARAASIIEVLGRAIVPDRGRLVTHVRSRLGASLMYNATWTAAELRGRRNDHKPLSKAPLPPPPQILFTPASTATMNVSYGEMNSQVGSIPLDMDMQMTHNASFEYQFPWGVWNDALFDAHELGGENHFYDESLPMYNLI
ncbi:hypothetical protein EG328_009377 [Venturia inaequalis]|uniref:Zn(2)-C6 fungal-type domain-containing protein n=1 Tax=Venturia inaequalis TaxID=5025 RepID=A0A8H3U8H3_VENIN|nr:hypothetical protein EG328_009377 [Venturia inaequalis]